MKHTIPFLLLLTSCGGAAIADSTTTTTTTTSTTTTTTTTVEVAPPPTTTTTTLPDTPCAEFYPAALAAGWPADMWPMVAKVMHRESTCNPDAYNAEDPNGGSHSLMQVNGVWLDWFLPDNGIAWTVADLYDPVTNLKAAYAIYTRQNNTFAAWGL